MSKITVQCGTFFAEMEGVIPGNYVRVTVWSPWARSLDLAKCVSGGVQVQIPFAAVEAFTAAIRRAEDAACAAAKNEVSFGNPADGPRVVLK